MIRKCHLHCQSGYCKDLKDSHFTVSCYLVEMMLFVSVLVMVWWINNFECFNGQVLLNLYYIRGSKTTLVFSNYVLYPNNE